MMGVLFVTEIAVGAFLLVQEPPIVLQVVYSAIAAAFWTLLVVLVVLAGLVSPVSTEEFSEAK
jgi:hypothetical protein